MRNSLGAREDSVGLFGFIGKILKGAAGVAANIATGNPIGAVKAGLGTVGGLLAHKQLGGAHATKINVLGGFRAPYAIPLLRGNATQSMPGSARALRQVPIMPGGAISTPSGMQPASGNPPAHYGGGGSGTHKRKRRSSSSARSSRSRSGGKRRGGGRKLKFGSPAWRKKYMKRKRR
jgi:hypothetical protein